MNNTATVSARNKLHTKKLVLISTLSALLIVMAFTPIGYLKVGLIEISFMMIPVTIGAILCGPSGGALLGLVFGITSFVQCFGMSTIGMVFFNINPLGAFVLCLIPRILAGWIAGLIYKFMRLVKCSDAISITLATFFGAVLNTVLFTLTMILFFWNDTAFINYAESVQLPVSDIWTFVVAFVGTNGLIEAFFSTIVGALISKSIGSLILGKNAHAVVTSDADTGKSAE